MTKSIELLGKRVPTKEQIVERAHQIYLDRGGTPGHEMDDWLQAEYELMHLPIHKIAEIEPRRTIKKVAKSVLKRSALVALIQTALMAGEASIS